MTIKSTRDTVFPRYEKINNTTAPFPSYDVAPKGPSTHEAARRVYGLAGSGTRKTMEVDHDVCSDHVDGVGRGRRFDAFVARLPFEPGEE